MEKETETVVKMPHSITEIVKGTSAVYQCCMGSKLIYQVDVNGYTYTFPIDVSNTTEVGNAVFEKTHKAITLMRYINMAIKNNELRWGKI